MRERHVLGLVTAMTAFAAMSVAALLISCGADDPETFGDNDTTGDVVDGTDTNTTGTDTDVGGGQTIFEPGASDAEFPDCIAGCGYDVFAPTFDYKQFARLEGRIDGECHDYGTRGFGADVDVIGVQASVRTMLEITVEAAPGSMIDPLVETHDGARLMTYSDWRTEGDPAARTMLVAPFVDPQPIYVVVYHAGNYDVVGGNCDGTVGGDDYGYVLSVRELPYEPQDLGDIAAGSSGTGSSTLTLGGEVQYFVFRAPGNSQPSVTLTRTGAAAFVPTIAGMKTTQGQLIWQGLDWDGDGDGTLVLSSDKFVACETDCDGVMAEFVFAVLDWQGMAWPGVFSFDVRADVP